MPLEWFVLSWVLHMLSLGFAYDATLTDDVRSPTNRKFHARRFPCRLLSSALERVAGCWIVRARANPLSLEVWHFTLRCILRWSRVGYPRPKGCCAVALWTQSLPKAQSLATCAPLALLLSAGFSTAMDGGRRAIFQATGHRWPSTSSDDNLR